MAVLTRLVGDPGEVPPVPLRCPSGTGLEPLIIFRGIIVNEMRIDQCSVNQYINKSTIQSLKLGNFSFYKLGLSLESTCIIMHTNDPVFKFPLLLWIDVLTIVYIY